MRARIVGLLIVTGILASDVVAAQSAGNTAAITPYTGYMFFGDILRGPIGTNVSSANGATFGAQLAVPLAGPVSVYANAGFARSDLTVGVPILGGLSIASTDAWLVDGGIELRVPSSGSITPVLQAGVGATRYSINSGFISTSATNATGVVGAGVDVAFSDVVGLRLMARDHIGRFDVQEAVFANIEGRTAHNVGLMAGLRLSF